MRYPLLVLAATLITGTSQARADQIVSYNMTGTVNPGPWDPVGVSSSSFNGNGGDHISWTMQYDLSTPGQPFSGGIEQNYSLKGAVITNIVDQTTGYHFPSIAIAASGIDLISPSSVITQMAHYGEFGDYDIRLVLVTNNSLPTMNLAKLQLNTLPPLNVSDSYLGYSYGVWSEGTSIEVGIGFRASVDSISGPYYGAPEPGSLTLFLLGVASLVIRRIRHLCLV